MNPAEFTQYLHEHIPLTRHMGVSVNECSEERVVLSAPLGPNINHRDTAFGGSLAGAAILASWAWLHAQLTRRGRRHRLVVHESTTHFDRPAEGPFEAICEAPPAEDVDRFFTALERRGKGRITLESRITCRGDCVARHTGRYVAFTRFANKFAKS